MSQSQDSQFSDNYPSSIFEENTVDNLTFLSSDDLQPFNPNTLYGQHTSSSTPNVGFTRPALPPTIPETLEHVGPRKKKTYVLWTEMVNDDFVAWWLKTEEEMEWTKRDDGTRRENRGIVQTLSKIRRLAIFVNKSPQRRENFLELQTKEPKLVPIQDVRTRWNSTFLMLRRAKRLQSVLNEFCSQYDNQELQPSLDEWRQIDYLLSITQPFFTFTTSLSKTKEITIHSVFAIYNTLFSHLEKSRAQLARKMVHWKKVMLCAIHAATLKLSEYYKLTNDIDGDLYAIGTILAPQNKLEFFSGRGWEPHWRVQYRKSLENYLVPYQQRYSETQSISSSQSFIGGISDVDILVTSTASLRPQTNAYDELSRYLGSSTPYYQPFCLKNLLLIIIGTQLVNPRIYWKEHQQEFPIIASLARDVLTTPASGSGVERLFNSARDICHYRRGSLKSKTIQDLMLFMCTTKFDMESEQLSLMNDYLTTQETQTAKEEKDARNAECEFDLISDSEDERSAVVSQIVQTASEPALGKRPRAENTTEDQEHVIELDERYEVPLPDIIHTQGESGTQRRSSGRLPKRARQDEDFVYERP
ncbi:hypothetical protein DTO002I6_8161 [Penicillium roqueforti]|nr:hypothetical protein DTO002I6_8161 [Penicillium roqueforti]